MLLHQESLTGFTPAAVKTSVIAADKLRVRRLSIYIVTVGQDVTVTLKHRIPTKGGPGGIDEVDLDLRVGKPAVVGTAFVFTTEDVYPGDLVVEITAGGVAPSRVEVVAEGL